MTAAHPPQDPHPAGPPEPPDAIAVTGLACRFPGASDSGTFWENLVAGRESLTFRTPEELAALGVPAERLADPRFVPAGGVLDGIDEFDHVYFGIPPREAALMDPQHRLFLQCAVAALEDAGQPAEGVEGGVGVWAAAGFNSYLTHHLLPHAAELGDRADVQWLAAGDKDYLATQTSYRLGLTGPSMSVQSACSSALLAVHLAGEALLSGECEVALAGAVSAGVAQGLGYLHTEGGILSADGHCRPFDAAATGTVFGSGVGIVVLKRLADALADGDTVRAVLLGSAVNNDGGRKVGFTAPSADGQARVITAAQAVAGVGPGDISLLEAHGTGTALGDRIELAALDRVFARAPDPRRVLGSVKSNVGHLDTCAGMAGLIKTVLSLQHRTLLPTAHFATPSPGLDPDRFRVLTEAEPWPGPDGTRTAGVSSFGIGGTNVHLVLRDAPPHRPVPPAPGPAWEVLPLSARTPEALDRLTARLDRALAAPDAPPAADAAHTLRTGRRAHPWRRAVTVARDRPATAAAGPGAAVRARADDPGVVLLFPGQGAGAPGTAAEPYRAEPVFRDALDRCLAALRPWTPAPLRSLLLDPGHPDLFDRTETAQPALFAVEYALTAWWTALGVRPAALAGHSVGEFAAACAAGVFTLEDAARLVAERGRLMSRMPPGAMLAVPLPEEELRRYAEEVCAASASGPAAGAARWLDVAAVNAPDRCVAAGEPDTVDRLAGLLADRGVDTRRLAVRHAFHTRHAAPLAEEFARTVAAVPARAPEAPLLSSVTGRPLTEREARSPEHWARQLTTAVRFADALRAAPDGVPVLEAGPGRALTGFARRALGPDRLVLPTLGLPDTAAADGTDTARPPARLTALARLWEQGADIRWSALGTSRGRRRVPLPTYPFARVRHWYEPTSPAPARTPDLRAPGPHSAGSGTSDLRTPDLRTPAPRTREPGSAESRAPEPRAAGSRIPEIRSAASGISASGISGSGISGSGISGSGISGSGISGSGISGSGTSGPRTPGSGTSGPRTPGSGTSGPRTPGSGTSDSGESGIAGSVDDWLHVLSWSPSAPPAADGRQAPARVLLLADDTGLAERVAERLTRDGIAVHTVRAHPGRPAAPEDGGGNASESGGRYVGESGGGNAGEDGGRGIGGERMGPGGSAEPSGPDPGSTGLTGSAGPDFLDPDRPEAFRALATALRQRGQAPDAVVSCWAVDDPPLAETAPEEVARCALRAVTVPARLGQALGEAFPGRPVHLLLVSNAAHGIGGQRPRTPHAAAALGPVRALPREVPGLTLSALDLDCAVHDAGERDRAADAVAAELLRGNRDEPLAAVRGRLRLTPALARPALAPPGPGAAVPTGTWVITGGLGGIGLAVAERLAEDGGRTLALLTRRPVPDGPAWRVIRRDGAAPAPDCPAEQARTLTGLTARGASVCLVQCDVTDPEDLAAALGRIRAAYGRIAGVVHAAGLPGGGTLARRSGEDIARVLEPKVRGTVLLYRLTAPDAPLVVLCSSVLAVAGAAGQADYGGANAFLDSFAHTTDTAVSIGWDRWSETGMAARAATGSAARTGTDTEVQAGADTEAWTGADTAVRAGLDTAARTGTDTEVRPGAGTEVRPGADTAAWAGTDTAVRVGADTAVRAGLDTAARTGTDTEVRPGAGTEVRPGADTAAWAGSGTEVRTGTGGRPAGDGAPPPAAPPAGEPLDHPLFAVRRDGGGRTEFALRDGPHTAWLAREHRLAGEPVLPGTALLDLAVAAHHLVAGPGPVELGAVFTRPLRMPADGPFGVTVRLRPRTDGGYDWEVRSPAHPQPHGQGRIAACRADPPHRLDLGALRARCAPSSPAARPTGPSAGTTADPVADSPADPAAGPTADLPADPAAAPPVGTTTDLAAAPPADPVTGTAALVTGPRWECATRFRTGEGEALLELRLPEPYRSDLDAHPLHPALLDVATGAVVDRTGGHLPVAYRRLTAHRALEAEVSAHVVLRSGAAEAGDTLIADVTLTDPGGDPLVSVEGLVLRPVPGEPGTDGGAAEARPGSAGIPTRSGLYAFDRVLAHRHLPHVLVSPRAADLPAARPQAPRSPGQPGAPDREREALPPEALPSLPPGDLERRIAEVWSRLLGVPRIGPDDSVFDFGADSLTIVQIAAELQRAGLAVSPGDLFAHPTVGRLAGRLRDGDASGPQPPAPPGGPPPHTAPEGASPEDTAPEEAIPEDGTPAPGTSDGTPGGDFPAAELGAEDLARVRDLFGAGKDTQ